MILIAYFEMDQKKLDSIVVPALIPATRRLR